MNDIIEEMLRNKHQNVNFYNELTSTFNHEKIGQLFLQSLLFNSGHNFNNAIECMKKLKSTNKPWNDWKMECNSLSISIQEIVSDNFNIYIDDNVSLLITEFIVTVHNQINIKLIP
eukprot:29111_1